MSSEHGGNSENGRRPRKRDLEPARLDLSRAGPLIESAEVGDYIPIEHLPSVLEQALRGPWLWMDDSGNVNVPVQGLRNKRVEVLFIFVFEPNDAWTLRAIRRVER